MSEKNVEFRLNAKSIVVEPRSTSDLSDAIAEFHKFLNQPKIIYVCTQMLAMLLHALPELLDLLHPTTQAWGLDPGLIPVLFLPA